MRGIYKITLVKILDIIEEIFRFYKRLNLTQFKAFKGIDYKQSLAFWSSRF